jgi:voltage-gated potassium channel
MRIYVADLIYPSSNKLKSGLKFILSPFGLIDLMAIIPFYIPFIISVDLRFLRILRITRFIRILKINRYNKAIDLIWKVVKEKKNELIMTGIVTLLLLVVASFLIYYFEGNSQPDKFPDIFSCFWWTLTTLTSLGNGTVYPITAFGKIISVLIAVLGIGLIALPTGIISAGFIEKLKKNDSELKQCPHCGKIINP